MTSNNTFNRKTCFLLVACVSLFLALYFGWDKTSATKDMLEYTAIWDSAEEICEINNYNDLIGTIYKHTFPGNILSQDMVDTQFENWKSVLQELGIYDFANPSVPYDLSSSIYSDWQFTFGEANEERTYYYFLSDAYIFEFRFVNNNIIAPKMNDSLADFIVEQIKY